MTVVQNETGPGRKANGLWHLIVQAMRAVLPTAGGGCEKMARTEDGGWSMSDEWLGC
jgi:hypothetical protein